MTTRRRVKFILALFALILITGCAPPTPAAISTPAPPSPTPAIVNPVPTSAATEPVAFPEEIVSSLVAAKLKAMEEKDIEQYLSLINEADSEYYTEQRNWFHIYQDALTSDFSIEVLGVEQIDDTTLVASLSQQYRYGPQKDRRVITFDQKYIHTAGGWKDADLNFEVSETPHFIVKYPREFADRVAGVAEEAETAYASVVQKLELEPDKKVTIKLYNNQELLRQSTDIRVAFLFNGWNEDGESIKLYAWRDPGTFAPILAHELTHQITLGVTDSLNSWLAEGLATYFGNRPFQGGSPLELGQFTVDDLSRPIYWLEETNLIEQTDGDTIHRYYAMSGMVVEFIVETYGLDQLKALLTELSKFPRYDRGFDYSAMEQENTGRLYQAVETVLGVDQEAFNQHWLDWIATQ